MMTIGLTFIVVAIVLAVTGFMYAVKKDEFILVALAGASVLATLGTMFGFISLLFRLTNQ